MNFPTTTGSFIIDWLTTRRFPHNAVVPKKWLLLKFPKFETCVIKNHGLRKFSFYTFLPVYSFDANMNISIIHDHLCYWRSNFAFPQTLHIQVFHYLLIRIFSILLHTFFNFHHIITISLIQFIICVLHYHRTWYDIIH